MASAGKLSDIAKGSCERLRNLYGKRVDDLVQEKAKDKLNQIRAKADGDRDTTD
jgi:CRISPR/Cas system-associated exonuclease Cas4 (RecB family)